MLAYAVLLALQTAPPPASPTPKKAAMRMIAESDAVTIQKGDLPILLSAPHGGHARLADAPDRTGKGVPKLPNGAGFTVAYDSYTDRLALATADEIEKRLGRRPYLVVMNVTRRQVDANRPQSVGVESEGPRRVYRAYHAALAGFRAEILRKFGKGLLIDLHGQGTTKDAIYRGTGDGGSVGEWTRFTGSEGLLTQIERAGIRLIPAGSEPGKRETAGFSGGWITTHYGARERDEDGKSLPVPGAFDAVQFETGIELRRPSAIPRTSAILADAIASYARRYLGSKEAGRA